MRAWQWWRRQSPLARTAQLVAAVLFVWGATCGDASDITAGPVAPPTSDIDNQAAVLARVSAGEPYYPVVIEETRGRGYPTNSPFNVRLPTLVWLLSLLPSLRAATAILLALAMATTLLWCGHFFTQRRRAAMFLAVPLTMTMLPIWLYDRAVHLNDVWAGQLIALSLAAHAAGVLPLSLVAGAAAVLVRELALPYVFAMALAALWQGGRREAWLWGVVGTIAAAALAWHTVQVRDFLSPYGLPNQWIVAGGWCFALRTARMNPVLMHLPDWFHAFAVSALLAGVWMWRGAAARPVALVLTAFLGLFLLVGRPDNSYWGLLIAPILPLGVLGWGRR
jgi:hypothetical protein